MIVFRTYCNVLIVLPIRLKTCRSNGFFLLGKMCASEKSRGSQKLCRPSTPDQHRARNLSSPDGLKKKSQPDDEIWSVNRI